jgi:signal transduction histidine kinase
MLLSGIDETAKGMRNLLRDLLQFSKLGATQLEKTMTDLDPIVKEVYCFYATNYNGTSTILPLRPAVINASAIRQLYSNLISNAIKYSSKTDAPAIEVGYYEKDRQIVYYVKDNGIGLNSEQLKKMFTPFKRFHVQFEGNGLGLVIVKRIIEKHGGNIWAESEPGKGLTIFFTLVAEMH